MKQKLHPKAVWIFFLAHSHIWIIFPLFLDFGAIPVITAMIIGKETPYAFTPISIIISIVATILIIYLCRLWAKLMYKFFLYELTEDALKIEHGVVYKKYVSIPYDRIQNIDIERGLIDRWIGLSDMHIQTAGYGNDEGPARASGMTAGLSSLTGEGRLPGLNFKIAEGLKNELIKRAKGKIGV